MSQFGEDARQMCGSDIRSRGVWPSDSARLEAFIGQYGGSLEAYPVGNVGVALRWIAGDRTLTRSGATTGAALESLRAAMVEA
ncbi:MAG: hypothetical protein RL487_1427 [Actinomycetota bacterium]|jgi:hypothetical protein